MTDTTPGGIARSQLHSIVQRIERLEQEKQALADDIREVYAEAKANGFDTKALRRIVKLRKKDAAEVAEFEAIVDTYRVALGMLADTPLCEAAIARDLGGSAVMAETEKKIARKRRRAADAGELEEA